MCIYMADMHCFFFKIFDMVSRFLVYRQFFSSNILDFSIFVFFIALKAIGMNSGPFPCVVHFTALQNEKARCFGTKG